MLSIKKPFSQSRTKGFLFWWLSHNQYFHDLDIVTVNLQCKLTNIFSYLYALYEFYFVPSTCQHIVDGIEIE